MKKYGYSLICSVILFAVLAFCFSKTEIYTDHTYPLGFTVEQASHNAVISIHESEDGTYYVFLPSYVDMDELKAEVPADMKVSLGDTSVADGMGCGAFSLETAYSLSVNDQYVTQLQFYKSANVATMYIDTITGSMERIHADKNYSEQASVMLYTAEGVLDATDSKAYMKGRGNSTWDYYGKRPYQLTLSAAADLLGMGTAEKWILLANAADPTNLNNKLLLDLARQTGQGWVPENAFVDVYVNGEYIGLYLLTEKVEVGPSRLDIDLQSGDFLCKTDFEDRWLSLKNPIKTQSGRTVEITGSAPLTDLSRSNIESAVNQMEQIIMSGADLASVESFDLDSWVHKYLIDEISANVDADLNSNYFYYSDGVFYGGPVWDYDISFGNNLRNISPTVFLAKNTYKSDLYISLYYPALYENESFRNRVAERYEADFLPILNQMTESGISDLAAEIQAASTMNYLCCYGTVQGWNGDLVHSVDGLISYLNKRVSFLNSAWIEGVEYCTVQFEYAEGTPYRNFAVPKGEVLVTDHVDLDNTVWIDGATGNAVDFSQPIWSDLIVTQQSALKVYAVNRDTIDPYIMILSVGLLLVLLLSLVCLDIHQRRKERRAANGTKQTHVSP